MNRIVSALSAMLIALAGAASAQNALTFNDIDSNGDGNLDLAEIEAAFPGSGQEVLDTYDSDDDGLVTAAEVSGATDPDTTNGTVTFADLDTNEDGVLDEDELGEVFGGNANTALQKFDQNGDGYVTRDEVRSSDDPLGERGKTKWGEAGPGNSNGTSTTTASSTSGNNGNGSGNGNGNGGGNGNAGGNGGGNGNGRNG